MRLLPFFLIVLVAAAHGPVATASNWPHLRGPESSGSIAAPGTFDAEEPGLEIAWKTPLGSGYSGIAIAGERAVTLYSDAESDWVIAFDPANAEELWRHRLGNVTKGRDGSDDGRRWDESRLPNAAGAELLSSCGSAAAAERSAAGFCEVLPGLAAERAELRGRRFRQGTAWGRVRPV